MPGVQKPHCRAWLLRKASCVGCSWAPLATPSMVCTLAPSHCTARIVQDLIASPLMWTTQAPHWLVSQPTWVPVRPRCSRRSCTSRVRPSTVAVAGFPFTVRLTVVCIANLPLAQTPGRGGPAALKRVSCAARAGSRRQKRGGRRAGSTGCGARARVHRLDEFVEEIVGHLARGAVDQPGADLRQFPADLSLDAVAQHRVAAVLVERDFGATLGKAGDAALALAGDRVAVGRVEIGQRDLAGEGRRYRPDLGADLGGE